MVITNDKLDAISTKIDVDNAQQNLNLQAALDHTERKLKGVGALLTNTDIEGMVETDRINLNTELAGVNLLQ